MSFRQKQLTPLALLVGVLILVTLGVACGRETETRQPIPVTTQPETDISKLEETNDITLEEALDLERRSNNPQITLIVLGPAQAFPSEIIVYTIEYTSSGMGTAVDVTIHNTFPDGTERILDAGDLTPGWTGREQLSFAVPVSTPVGTVLEERVEARFKNNNGQSREPVFATFQTTVK